MVRTRGTSPGPQSEISIDLSPAFKGEGNGHHRTACSLRPHRVFTSSLGSRGARQTHLLLHSRVHSPRGLAWMPMSTTTWCSNQGRVGYSLDASSISTISPLALRLNALGENSAVSRPCAPCFLWITVERWNPMNRSVYVSCLYCCIH
jgi:hypothetical protein